VGRHVVAEVGLDVGQSGGARRRQKFSQTNTVSRLSYAFSPSWGLQAEIRTNKLNAVNDLTGTFGVGDEEALDRSDMVLRGRGMLPGSIALEAMVGRSRQTPAGDDSVTLAVREVQASAQASVPLGFGTLAVGGRLHHGEAESWAPNASELWGRLDLAPAGALAASGEVHQLSIGGVSGVEGVGRVRVGPWGGLALFGELAAGSRGIRYQIDTTRVLQTIAGIGGAGFPTLDTLEVREFRTVAPTLTGLRAGAELNRGRLHLGAAFLHHDVDQVAPYGLAFDRATPLQPGQALSGVEGYASVPLLVRTLTLEGWYLRWLGTVDRPYLPVQQGRAALQFHGVYRDGNLEPTLRFEVVGRDQTEVWDPATGAPRLLPRYGIFNWYVQVRIIDLRIFWRFDNAFAQRGEYDVAHGVIPGGRALYGVRWYFRN
jgi:hypothetical protein